MASSSSLYSVSLSASLPSLVTSSSLSTSSSSSSGSSSYYRGDSAGHIAFSSTFSSIHDLQALADPELYQPWTADDSDLKEPSLPFVHAPQRRSQHAPFCIRLKRALFSARRRCLHRLEDVSLWDVIVTVTFCFYLWILLRACAGYGGDPSSGAVRQSLCGLELASSLSRNPVSGYEDLSPPVNP